MLCHDGRHLSKFDWVAVVSVNAFSSIAWPFVFGLMDEFGQDECLCLSLGGSMHCTSCPYEGFREGGFPATMLGEEMAEQVICFSEALLIYPAAPNHG